MYRTCRPIRISRQKAARNAATTNWRQVLPMRYILALLALLLAPFAPAAFAQAHTQQAVFAGGCFWCMEHDMQAIPGVVKVESGYTGGWMKNPHYEDVIKENTGHYESVRVTFDTD